MPNDSQLNRGIRVEYLLDLFPISLSSTWHARLSARLVLAAELSHCASFVEARRFRLRIPLPARALPNILHRVGGVGRSRVVEPLYPCSCAFLDLISPIINPVLSSQSP